MNKESIKEVKLVSFINVEPTPQGWTNQFRSQFVNCSIDLTLNRSNIYVFMPKIDA